MIMTLEKIKAIQLRTSSFLSIICICTCIFTFLPVTTDDGSKLLHQGAHPFHLFKSLTPLDGSPSLLHQSSTLYWIILLIAHTLKFLKNAWPLVTLQLSSSFLCSLSYHIDHNRHPIPYFGQNSLSQTNRNCFAKAINSIPDAKFSNHCLSSCFSIFQQYLAGLTLEKLSSLCYYVTTLFFFPIL